METTPIELTLTDVLTHHLKGGKFQYLSYDHHKALAEYKTSNAYADESKSFEYFSEEYKPDKWYLPKELIAKHAYWRDGKLRSVEFNPDGTIKRVYVGARRSRSFYSYNLDELKLIQ